jgi:hypothetical protein
MEMDVRNTTRGEEDDDETERVRSFEFVVVPIMAGPVEGDSKDICLRINVSSSFSESVSGGVDSGGLDVSRSKEDG